MNSAKLFERLQPRIPKDTESKCHLCLKKPEMTELLNLLTAGPHLKILMNRIPDPKAESSPKKANPLNHGFDVIFNSEIVDENQ